MEDEGGELPAFLANDVLDDSGKRARAPADRVPYCDAEDTAFCFASAYAPDEADAANLGANELREAFAQMQAIIDKHYGNNTSMGDLLDAVHEFYETRIRSAFDYGEWTRKSIYRYIMQHSAAAEDRQAAEAIKVVWCSIEMLRENVATVDEATGKATPDLRMIKALSDAIKLHSGLLDARRKRPKVTAS